MIIDYITNSIDRKKSLKTLLDFNLEMPEVSFQFARFLIEKSLKTLR